MKKLALLSSLVLCLLLSTNSDAKEYKFKKSCNAYILVEELKEAGIILEGPDQVGSLNTTQNEITIITKKDIDVFKLTEVIENHRYKTPTQIEKEAAKAEKKRIDNLKASIETNLVSNLGFTLEEAQFLLEGK